MATIRLATEEDKKKWNKVAQQSPEATYAHTWEWKEVIEKGFGVKSLCIVAEDRGDIVGIYPGFLYPKEFSLKFLRNYNALWSPFELTWDYGGPCILQDSNIEIIRSLLLEMEKISKNMNVFEIRLSSNNDDLKKELISMGYRISPRLTSIIDLTKEEEELWKGLKKRTRNPINQALRFSLEFKEKTDEEGMNILYKFLKEVSGRTDMYLPPLKFFELLLEKLRKKEMMRIYITEHNGMPVGSALILCHNETITTRYWAAPSEYLKFRPYNFLIWNLLIEGKKLGYKKCDLGGMPSDKNNGIYIFKSGWNGKIKEVNWYIKDIKFSKLRELRRRIKRII
jgi:lipid II:glycine glycyltransferase (peptidoglycan interpeptide bridge formation enzyme)